MKPRLSWGEVNLRWSWAEADLKLSWGGAEAKVKLRWDKPEVKLSFGGAAVFTWWSSRGLICVSLWQQDLQKRKRKKQSGRHRENQLSQHVSTTSNLLSRTFKVLRCFCFDCCVIFVVSLTAVSRLVCCCRCLGKRSDCSLKKTKQFYTLQLQHTAMFPSSPRPIFFLSGQTSGHGNTGSPKEISHNSKCQCVWHLKRWQNVQNRIVVSALSCCATRVSRSLSKRSHSESSASQWRVLRGVSQSVRSVNTYEIIKWRCSPSPLLGLTDPD